MQSIVRPPGVLDANTLVVDRDGRLISRDNRTQLDIRSNVSAYSPVRLSLNGNEGTVQHSDSWDGNVRVSAYSPVPITGWSVITSVPATTLNAAFYRQLMLIAGALGLLIVGFTSFSYYASRQLSEPLSTMAQKAQVIARGGYGTRLEVPKEKELGTIAGAINDLKSEVRVKERRMSEADEQFHLLLRDLPVGVLLLGAHGEYIESNAALRDMLGVTEDELSENTAFSMDWPVRGTFRKDGKPKPQERDPIVLAYTTRRQETSEPVEIYRADAGDRLWLRISAKPQLESDGTVKRMICTFVNVTERRLLEEALQMAKFSLDHAPDEVLWITSDGQLYYVNDAACDKLGYTHDRLLSMSIWDVDTGFTRDDWPERWRELKELKYLNFESGHVTRSGAVFPANVAMHYMEFKGKEYAISFVRDIGEIKRVQDNLARAEVDLSRAQRIARIGTWTWNLENDQAQWSDEVYRILEISRSRGCSFFPGVFTFR